MQNTQNSPFSILFPFSLYDRKHLIPHPTVPFRIVNTIRNRDPAFHAIHTAQVYPCYAIEHRAGDTRCWIIIALPLF